MLKKINAGLLNKINEVALLTLLIFQTLFIYRIIVVGLDTLVILDKSNPILDRIVDVKNSFYHLLAMDDSYITYRFFFILASIILVINVVIAITKKYQQTLRNILVSLVIITNVSFILFISNIYSQITNILDNLVNLELNQAYTNMFNIYNTNVYVAGFFICMFVVAYILGIATLVIMFLSNKKYVTNKVVTINNIANKVSDTINKTIVNKQNKNKQEVIKNRSKYQNRVIRREIDIDMIRKPRSRNRRK